MSKVVEHQAHGPEFKSQNCQKMFKVYQVPRTKGGIYPQVRLNQIPNPLFFPHKYP
jgi:hypothetical protein